MKRQSSILVALSFLALFLAVTSVFGQKFDATGKASLAVNGQRCGTSLVLGPRQNYSQLVSCGSMMTKQIGTYVISNGVLTLNVIDWEPKQRYVLDNGYSGHWEPNAKPPGGSYRIKFPSADSMVWQDINFGGIVTFRRSQ